MKMTSKICRAALLLLYGSTALARDTQPLDSIREAAESFMKAQAPKGSTAIATAGALDARLRLAKCGGPLEVSIPTGASTRSARTTVGVRCEVGATWTVYVPVTLESEIPVLVLQRAVARGARVTEQDVAVETRRVSGSANAYLTKIADLQAQTAKRPLPVGTVLSADAFVADMVVKRGEQVTLLAAAGGFEVRAPGRALADGREGAYLKAQNLSSLAVVEGVVVGPGVIRVTP